MPFPTVKKEIYLILEVSEEIVIRTNPNATEETYFATTGGGGGTCVGYCCTSSSHSNTKPAA